MQVFIHEYLGTVVVALILAAVLTLIIVKMVKNKKAGKSSCSCGACQGCPNAACCHRQDGCGRYGHKDACDKETSESSPK